MAASLDNQLLEEMTLFDLESYKLKSSDSEKKLKNLKKLAVTAMFNPLKRERKRAQGKIWEEYSELIKSLDVYGEKVVIRMTDSIVVSEFALCSIPDYLMDQPYHSVLFSN